MNGVLSFSDAGVEWSEKIEKIQRLTHNLWLHSFCFAVNTKAVLEDCVITERDVRKNGRRAGELNGRNYEQCDLMKGPVEPVYIHAVFAYVCF